MQELDDAAEYLCQQRLIGKAKQRDRRPTAAELEALSESLGMRDMRAEIPMQDIISFAIHSARRQEQITHLCWEDLDVATATCRLRDVKHPMQKLGNCKTLVAPAALEVIERQPRRQLADGTDCPLIFPYNPKSIGAAFTRACHVLAIRDLRFHDLRHEATIRLFEAGYGIHEVALFTLHESWATLKWYTNLRPENLQHKGRAEQA